MPALRLAVILAVAFLLLGFPALAEFATDWLWFGEVGYRPILVRALVTEWAIGIAVFAAAFGVLFGNWRYALGSLRQPFFLIGPSTGQIRPVVLERRRIRTIATGAALFVAFVVALFSASQWLLYLRAWYGVPFGVADPIFGHDVAFYVFTLPWLRQLRGLLLLLLVLAAMGAGAIYALGEAVRFDLERGLVVTGPSRRHLAVLAAVFFLLLAAGAYLERPELLLSTGDVLDGASYVDVHARAPALLLLALAALAGAGLALYQAVTPAKWPLPLGIGVYLLVWLAGAGYAAIVQRFFVAPNEQVRETPFMIHNIEATRAAFALDGVEERELSGDASLTLEDIERNAETIDNVRLWDHQPLLDTFGQIQEIRTYYDFVSVDNDRYHIDGDYRQTMVSARELNSESLPNRTWINERLVFTHGYGVAMGPVNEVTLEGLPVLFVKNLPPESTVDLAIDEPSIYFGELSNDHVFVGTRAEEFHYPRGDDNVYATYEGRGGVPIGGLLRKLLFSIRFGSFKLLLSDDISPESRVMFHRQIVERMTTIAPFLSYDPDPYLVAADGRLYWICDAYTATSRYPYSSPIGSLNYIRNSVKVVIDAYHGTVDYYVADPADPLVRTLQAIFPEFLKPLDRMPEALRAHIRYPERIFSLQTAVFSTFHMTNPAVFYNKEDQWEIPSIDAGGNPVLMQPYYTIMRLPGADRAEFIQMLPFTPRRKDNLAAWMVARSDAPHYGKLQVFQFPKQKVIFGPRQIVGRINQDQLIAPQITLWNQQGSEVIWGTLLVIPIEESLLYIRPLYLRSEGGRIPELKRVIVAHQNQIVMAETLQMALDQLFGAAQPGLPERLLTEVEGEEPVPPPAPAAFTEETQARMALQAGEDATDIARQAREQYQLALEAQRQGDWSGYGDHIRRLGELLERLEPR